MRPQQTPLSLQIRQLDVNRYMARFLNVTWHIPDLVAEELKESTKFTFVGTRRPDLEKPLTEMEVLIKHFPLCSASLTFLKTSSHRYT